MERVSIYLHFMGQTKGPLSHYGSIFGTEPTGLQRMRDTRADPSGPTIPEDELDRVMHVELEFFGGHRSHGNRHARVHRSKHSHGEQCDDPSRVGRRRQGTENHRLPRRRATDMVPFTPQFWGAHWGVCLDRFGICWMGARRRTRQCRTARFALKTRRPFALQRVSAEPPRVSCSRTYSSHVSEA
jgi:PhnB protein